MHANKHIIANQLIMLDITTFFFPGPEWLSRIGCGTGGAAKATGRRPSEGMEAGMGETIKMEQPLLFRVGAAFIRKGGTPFPDIR